MEVKLTHEQSPPYTISQPLNSSPGHNDNPAYPRPIEVSRDVGCFERNQRNKPQSNSAGAATLVFVTGGMNIAWATGFASMNNIIMPLHMQICWFIAAIVGAGVGAAVCNKFQKKFIFVFSCVLVIIGGILLISLSHDRAAIIAARYFNGFANGLALIPTLVLVGEEGVKSIRGMLASSVDSMSFTLGIYLQIIYRFIWADGSESSSSLNLIQMQGLLTILFGIISSLIVYFFTIESPIFYLTHDQEELAIDTLRRLQRPSFVTTETYEQLEEHKRYIGVNKEMSLAESATAGLPALFKLCIYRGLVAMSFSYLLTDAMLITSTATYGPLEIWPYIIYGTLRLLGVFTFMFMMDPVGRKIPILFTAPICAGLIIGIGVVTNNFPNILFGYSVESGVYLLFVFQFFVGAFISSSSVYMSEAFPLAVKPYYVAISFSAEMLVQIIIFSCDKTVDSISEFCFTFGALLFLFFIFGIVCLPETKHTTLREAQQKFRKFITPQN